MSYSPVKFVFFIKSRLIFNVFYCFTMFVYKHFTNITGIQFKNSYNQKCEKFIWICIHLKIYSFQYVFISICTHFNVCSFQYIFISICIHFSIYSFECIGSNFFFHIFITQKQSFDFFCKSIDDRFICVLKNKNAQENQK